MNIEHVRRLAAALDSSEAAWRTAERWGRQLAERLPAGARLLATGNGGSAAQAQHLTAELVGRYCGERRPLSALALHAETSSVTAIANDYGADEIFARQVEAHARPGDICLFLSTSGRSSNLLAAAVRARESGATVWAMTGCLPNPLAELADDVLAVDCPDTCTVQELHLIAVHLICEHLDEVLGVELPFRATSSPQTPAAPAAHRSPATPRRPVAQRSPAAQRPAAQRPPARGAVVVVGDVLLDVDVLATADRLTPDGPAPVLDERDRIERGGGAALAATLAAAKAEAPVRLVAPIPDDEAGRRVREVLDPAIEVIALPCTGSTPVKTRLRAGGVTVARLDRAGGSTVGIDAVPPEAAAAIRSAGAVLVSDYGGGTTADQRVRELLTEAAAHLPVVWDPHPRGTAPVPGATLVTPNSAEAGRLSGRPGEDVAAAREQADELRAQWQARAVVVTLGSRGALLSFGTGAATVVPTPVQVPGDTCGAGDSFAAAAAAALARGALPSEAVAAAVSAATDFVAGGGVARPTADRAGPASADVDALLAAVRARGGTVVATGGCFDLLHAGHVATLEAARALGDCLVVCLNSDDSVRRLKGDGRPLQPAQDRARVLAALDAVDAVVVFDEDTPVDVLRRLRPALWVKGGDYAAAELPETELLRSWGGEVVTVPYLPGRSTSGLVELSRR